MCKEIEKTKKNIPTLYMLVGLAGSGKSTYSKRLSELSGADIFSSDELRMELFGNTWDMTKNGELFGELEKRIRDNLISGKSSIYDATNLSNKKRVAFLKYIKKVSCKKVCIIVYSSYENCIKQNNERERQVPEYVIENMIKSWHTPYYGEGWDRIIIHYNSIKGATCKSVEFFPYNKLDYMQHNKNHEFTLGNHCLKTRDYAVKKFNKEKPTNINYNILYFASLLHDCGKPFCQTYYNSKIELTEEAHYYQHENAGAYFVIGGLKATLFPFSVGMVLDISVLINYHMRPYFAWSSDKARIKDLNCLGQDMYDSLMILHEADVNSHGEIKNNKESD